MMHQTERQIVQLALAIASARHPPRGGARSRPAVDHGPRRARPAGRQPPRTIRLHPDDFAATGTPRERLAAHRTCRSWPIPTSARAAAWCSPTSGSWTRASTRSSTKLARALLAKRAATARRGGARMARLTPSLCSLPGPRVAASTRCRSAAASCATSACSSSRAARARASAKCANCRPDPAAGAAGRSRRLPRRPAAVGAARRHGRHPARRPHRRAGARSASVPRRRASARPRHRRPRAGRSTAWGRCTLTAQRRSTRRRSTRSRATRSPRRSGPASAPSTRC